MSFNPTGTPKLHLLALRRARTSNLVCIKRDALFPVPWDSWVLPQSLPTLQEPCTPFLVILNFFVEGEIISFSACILQYFLFVSLPTTEGLCPLDAMAYDNYVAIVNPLLYTVAMTKLVCIGLVLGSCIGGLINSVMHTIGLMKLSFCGPNIISHFFCDLPHLLKLPCTDTSMNELLLLVFTTVITMMTFLTVMISYIFIVAAILRIRSAAGRHKAYSTWASHLTAVTLFYGSISFSYIQPSSQYFLEQEKVVSVFYTLVIPMLNPLIYSLRNKEVKDAVKRVMDKKLFYCRFKTNIHKILI
ncbi:LOW QUALITY PROTEIN: olfactory receptor 1052-like [Mesocricetus auratus]|uniref:LOW QUALITY PROTEIN: olfactory receptor 1052-like n=1 Tax=Mesocricetus auratus TaxID=10036 RepID=A0A1U8CGC0_MESAU|nr:LOW QUALITY PROTEIN: olfactory receptor 1052-like [Mesocricetus auratus]